MIERRVYHVVRGEDDFWQVLKEGFRRPHFIRETKEDAVRLAKRLAKINPEARVVVHTDDNSVEREFRYGSTQTPV